MDPNDFKERVALFRTFDIARQDDLEKMAESYEAVAEELRTVKADLEDEQQTRRSWRRRAEIAENSVVRNQFALVLIDGDGYYFAETFLKDAGESGGARAAHQLYSDILAYLRSNGMVDASIPEFQIMVNVYANRAGLARTLYEANIIQTQNQLDQFFCSFAQSQSLFQFIDCGYGKERADAKLRDTYRFFAYNAQCKYVFLACCHDGGYVAELDKYRHDPVAAPKTILVQSTQMARQYSTLNFPIAPLPDVFDSLPSHVAKKETPSLPPTPQSQPATVENPPVHVPTGPASNGTQPTTWSAVMGNSNQNSSTKVQIRPAATSANSDGTQQSPRGIPINRLGQRLDRKLRAPTPQEIADFEQRIRFKKLCNRFHLSGDCPTYNCKYDHDPIDASLKNTLKLKARSIPCTQGQECRQADCFYGHQCPWGMEKCANPKCPYLKYDMHNVADTEVAKVVPAEDHS